jgi:hypothetical protein
VTDKGATLGCLLADVARGYRPAKRLEPILNALVDDTKFAVQRIVFGERSVTGLSHLEHVKYIVIFKKFDSLTISATVAAKRSSASLSSTASANAGGTR